MKDGSLLRKRLVDIFGLLEPDLVGQQFGSLKIISRKTESQGFNLLVEVSCDQCGHTHMARYHNMRKRPSRIGCWICKPRLPVVVPKWLYQRCQAQQSRCNNSSNESFSRYGGRG